jgi:hypothetical protein
MKDLDPCLYSTLDHPFVYQNIECIVIYSSLHGTTTLRYLDCVYYTLHIDRLALEVLTCYHLSRDKPSTITHEKTPIHAYTHPA